MPVRAEVVYDRHGTDRPSSLPFRGTLAPRGRSCLGGEGGSRPFGMGLLAGRSQRVPSAIEDPSVSQEDTDMAEIPVALLPDLPTQLAEHRPQIRRHLLAMVHDTELART
jgi:hypothetical protein